jgi:hypothetical protein
VKADEFLTQLHGFGYRAHTIDGPAKAGHYRNMLGPAINRAADDAIVSIVLVPTDGPR